MQIHLSASQDTLHISNILVVLWKLALPLLSFDQIRDAMAKICSSEEYSLTRFRISKLNYRHTDLMVLRSLVIRCYGLRYLTHAKQIQTEHRNLYSVMKWTTNVLSSFIERRIFLGIFIVHELLAVLLSVDKIKAVLNLRCHWRTQAYRVNNRRKKASAHLISSKCEV